MSRLPTGDDDRAEAMRSNGIYACPGWCAQDPHEHESEAHASIWRGFAEPDGTVIEVRPRLSWLTYHDGRPIEAHVDLRISPGDLCDEDYLALDAEARQQLRDLLDDAESDLDTADQKSAYDGADADWEAAEADDDSDDTEQVEPAAGATTITDDDYDGM